MKHALFLLALSLAIAATAPAAGPAPEFTVTSLVPHPFMAKGQGLLVTAGEGARHADILLAIGTDPGNLPEPRVNSRRVRPDRTFRLSPDNLRPDTRYFYRVTASNDLGVVSAPVTGEFATPPESPLLLPGLYQGRLPGQVNWDQGLRFAKDVHRELGPVMGLIFTDESMSTKYESAFSGVTTAWAGDTTFLYKGYMWLVADTPYAFGTDIDDFAGIVIDGKRIHDHRDCRFHATTYKTDRTGWHEIEIRVGNGWGDAGARPMGNVGNLGLAYNTTGATGPEAGNWPHALIDDGSGMLFGCPPPGGATNAVRVAKFVDNGTHLLVNLEGSLQLACTVYAWSGRNYGGTDEKAWAKSVRVGDFVGERQTEKISFKLPLDENTRFVRFVAVSDEYPERRWASDTIVTSKAGEPPK